MNILILGDRARYDRYMPPFVRDLPLTIADAPAFTPAEELLRLAPDTEVLLADASSPVPAVLIGGLPRLRLIHTDGVGFNGVDVDAAAARNIPVCHCKGCNADAVAEAAVMLMLMVTRQAVPGYRAVVEGRQLEYKEEYMRSNRPEFADHTIGLVGLGDIGTATRRRLVPFGNRVYYYSLHRRTPEEEKALNVTYLPLEELVERCDILSLHCALNRETEGLVNDALLKGMKPGAYLINTGRGQLMDNDAVRRALLSGRLGGAAFDTLWPEPTPADHPLVALPPEVRDRVVYLPHLGGNTGPAFQRAYGLMWDNVRRLLAGEPLLHVVNG